MSYYDPYYDPYYYGNVQRSRAPPLRPRKVVVPPVNPNEDDPVYEEPAYEEELEEQYYYPPRYPPPPPYPYGYPPAPPPPKKPRKPRAKKAPVVPPAPVLPPLPPVVVPPVGAPVPPVIAPVSAAPVSAVPVSTVPVSAPISNLRKRLPKPNYPAAQIPYIPPQQGLGEKLLHFGVDLASTLLRGPTKYPEYGQAPNGMPYASYNNFYPASHPKPTVTEAPEIPTVYRSSYKGPTVEEAAGRRRHLRQLRQKKRKTAAKKKSYYY